MLIGTAGHIDHGKTTLIRALTGVDTMHLPEEKARGITIELGYAYAPVEGTGDGGEAVDTGRVLGFIDVPGHERFVPTMLMGAAGIDYALLVVAADDGVMPQTREHLAILHLLGIERSAVALTKCDRVEPARIAEVQADIASLLAPTRLARSPVCWRRPVSPAARSSPCRRLPAKASTPCAPICTRSRWAKPHVRPTRAFASLPTAASRSPAPARSSPVPCMRAR